MNKAESAAAEQFFAARGWTASSRPETADIVIINTCSVRATAETRIYGRLGWYQALKNEREGKNGPGRLPEKADAERGPLTVVVMGCMAERLKETMREQFPVVDYVVGTFQKQHFDDIISAVEQRRSPSVIDEDPVYSFAPLSCEPGAFRAFVPIMHGCNNFCSFCIVPYLRGREVSRPPSEIIAEIDLLTSRGVREITLLGQNVNSYMFRSPSDAAARADGIPSESDTDFPRLMQLIADRLRQTGSGIRWVRFMSSHPKDLSDRLLDVIARERVFCRHIHLPVQHGSSAVLASMNRKYTREQYLSLVARIRNALPDVSLSTDILIGFPGETPEDFEQTVSLMNEVRFENAFMYYYNPREGTAAYTFDNPVPPEEQKERLARIIDIQLRITREEMEKRTGQTVPVLVEAVSRDSEAEVLGHTERDERVVFPAGASLIGSFVSVKLEALSGNTFRGTRAD